MPYSFLTLDIDPRGAARVALDRAEVHNAFNEVLIAELTAVFAQLDADDQVRLAVLSGNGKSFCAGGDLHWMKAMKGYSLEENKADALRLAQMFERIRLFSKPLIGVIQGVALGGGSGLAAVCDYVIAAEDTQFGFTETRLGLVPATIAPYVMEKIGSGNARAYFLSGSMFSAPVARDIGLVQRLAPRDMLAAARDETIIGFLKAGPQAARAAKTLINRIPSMEMDKVTDYTVQTIADIRVGAEAQEGMSALLEHRNPQWMKK